MTANKNTKQTNGKENKREYTQQDMIDFFKSHVIVCGIPTNKKEE